MNSEQVMGGGYVLPRGSRGPNGGVELGFKGENGFATQTGDDTFHYEQKSRHGKMWSDPWSMRFVEEG